MNWHNRAIWKKRKSYETSFLRFLVIFKNINKHKEKKPIQTRNSSIDNLKKKRNSSYKTKERKKKQCNIELAAIQIKCWKTPREFYSLCWIVWSETTAAVSLFFSFEKKNAIFFLVWFCRHSIYSTINFSRLDVFVFTLPNTTTRRWKIVVFVVCCLFLLLCIVYKTQVGKNIKDYATRNNRVFNPFYLCYLIRVLLDNFFLCLSLFLYLSSSSICSCSVKLFSELFVHQSIE